MLVIVYKSYRKNRSINTVFPNLLEFGEHLPITTNKRSPLLKKNLNFNFMFHLFWEHLMTVARGALLVLGAVVGLKDFLWGCFFLLSALLWDWSL